MASPLSQRPAPFGAESTLKMVRLMEQLMSSLRSALRNLRLEAAVSTVPARALSDVGVARPAQLDPRYSQFSARV